MFLFWSFDGRSLEVRGDYSAVAVDGVLLQAYAAGCTT